MDITITLRSDYSTYDLTTTGLNPVESQINLLPTGDPFSTELAIESQSGTDIAWYFHAPSTWGTFHWNTTVPYTITQGGVEVQSGNAFLQNDN